MRSLRVGILILSVFAGLLVGGCAATLETRVEVYHPKSRLQELDETDPEQKRLISLINDRLVAEKELLARSEGHLTQMADDVIANLQCFEPALEEVVEGVQDWSKSQPAATKSGYESVARTLETESKATIKDATQAVQEARLALVAGTLEPRDFISTLNDTASEFAEKYKASLDLIRQGDPRGIPPKLAETLERRDATLSGCSQKLYDLTVGQFKIGASEAVVQRAVLQTDRSGVRHPDAIEETYTDPLLAAALNDKEGWLAIPAATKTSADGKSDVVIVRDGQFSFSVHTLENDPSTVIRHRLNLANSTINLLSTLAGAFAGVEIPGAPASGEPADDESPDSEEIPAEVLVRVARSRLNEAERLLAQTPSDTASRKRWINEVNALLQPVTGEGSGDEEESIDDEDIDE